MTPTSALPFGSQELIRESSDRWKQFEGLEEATLLRLPILRDLANALHTEKSHNLATRKHDHALQLKSWQTRIYELRGCHPLTGDLMELLTGKAQAKKRALI